MAKNEVLLKCPKCGHDRFQYHARGKLVAPDTIHGINYDLSQFVQDETVVQCVGCHYVCPNTELVK